MENIRTHELFNITITDITIPDAIIIMDRLIKNYQEKSNTIFFVNAHTLNLAIKDKYYLNIINSGNYVFGDGTGVRWATKLIIKEKFKDNVNGTDLIPKFMRTTANQKYKYFLLGATPEDIETASKHVSNNFSGWELAGYHHGYFKLSENIGVVNQINESGAQLLLVGMGNPLQEKWVYENCSKLKIPLIVGVGGLFTYWAGKLDRAPLWMRKIGIEWIYILRRQPKKWKRYTLGNMLFLFRIANELLKK